MPDPRGIKNVITTAGRAMLPSSLQDNQFVEFTRAVVGDAVISSAAYGTAYASPADQTALVQQLGAASISKKTIQGTSLVVSVQYTNALLSTAKSISEIGIYARVGTKSGNNTTYGNEALFSYMIFGDYPDTILDKNTAAIQRIYDIPYSFDGATQTQITISATAMVTQADTVEQTPTSSPQPAQSSNAGKIVKLNSDGKMPVDITGDANTLDGHDSTYFSPTTHTHSVATTSANGFMSTSDRSNLTTLVARVTQSLKTTDSPTFAGLNLSNGYIDNARFR